MYVFCTYSSTGWADAGAGRAAVSRAIRPRSLIALALWSLMARPPYCWAETVSGVTVCPYSLVGLR
jgi:hypothetical protein